MRKIKNVLVLAGGDSTRFWPLKDKMFWSFLGNSLIKNLIAGFSGYSENIFVVVSHSNLAKIKKTLDNKVHIIIQKNELKGIGGAILSCQDKINGETLIVNASDIFVPTLIKRLIKELKPEKEMILFAKRYDDYFPGGYLKFTNGRLVEIVEKPGKDITPSKLVKLVFDYFGDLNHLINALKKINAVLDDWYESAINQLIKNGIKNDVFEHKDYLYPLKYPWQVLIITDFFLKTIKSNKIDNSAVISKNAVIKGPVYIGKNVKIGDFAKISGPVFIDDGATIADHTIIYQSHIGKSCLVGGYSEVTRSYLSEGVMLHRNYVGDSVLGSQVMMGAGVATANFRFDGKNISSRVNENKIDTGLIKFGAIIGNGAKIGVNSTILPGIKIGSNTFIAPGEIVQEDIKNNIFFIKGKKRNNKIVR